MPYDRKGPSHDFRPKIRGRRMDMPAGSSTRRGRRNLQKSPPIGETITLNAPEIIGLSPGTDYEADSHNAPSPMDIDISVPDESTARQPPETPDSTRQKREASGDNGWEEHTHRGGSEHEATATNPPRDDIVAGPAVRGGAASPPPQGYAPAKPPGPPTTHTSVANPYNGLEHENWQNRIEKQLISLSIRQDSQDTLLNDQKALLNDQKARIDDQKARIDNQKARIDGQKARIDDQDIRLGNHEARLDKHDAILESIPRIESNIERLMARVDALCLQGSERTPRYSRLPATPTSPSNVSPAASEVGPRNEAGPTDSQRRLRSHGTSNVGGTSGGARSTRSGRNRSAR